MSFVELGLSEYLLRMFVELFFFHAVFMFIYRIGSMKNQLGVMFLAIPFSFLGQIYVEGMAEVLGVTVYYLFLKKNTVNKNILLSALVFSATIPYLISTVISGFILTTPFLDNYSDLYYVILELLIEICLLVGFIYFLKVIQFSSLLITYSSKFSFLLLSLNFCLIQLYLNLTEYFQLYEQLILGTLCLLFAQFFLLFLLFVREMKKQKKIFEEKFLREQLEHLKLYAGYLEKNQEKLRRFKHDYKNLLFSLREAALNNRADLVIEQIDLLSDYSENCFKSNSFHYSDIKNVKNEYLKSLLISKFHRMENENVHCHFECLAKVDTLSIKIFDLVRILGISIDNAIEEASQVNDSEVYITIFQTKPQIEFIIENSTRTKKIDISKIKKCGYSTKIGHDGLGLSSIQDIKEKYSNVFIQYKSSQNKFIAQIIIVNE
ncbi:sensor histidine kinase [Enterococcus villorum]|uniref:Bacteriocin production protein n=2 Tax=Enterococcus villorum TaxID=112904 RepID=A0A511J4U4_9ENTE|nr:GHKL domain-containing protein [Enterococcus villorum]EOH87369.1 hypothetical protein UAO_02080 [Enterococcus villorum ATCC 700913]EOW77912.1 hypothetical protein I591_00766 [Enterococcus villorum ATCC 700913]GEL93027.1 bacteriocin production protein [Enterococcus villorum]